MSDAFNAEEAVAAYDALIAFATDPSKKDAVEAKEAEITFCAHEAVPNNEPVKAEPDTMLAVTLFANTVLREASEPDTMTFFQFGIILHSLRLDT